MCDAGLMACMGAWANVGVAVGTILLAVIAAFSERIKQRFLKPELVVTSNDVFARFTVRDREGNERISGIALFLRLRITNDGGRGPAQNVEVCVNEVGMLRNGAYRRMREGEYPKGLVWSNFGKQTSMPSLHPGTTKFADVGHVHDPAVRGGLEYEEPEPPAVTQAVLGLEVNPVPISRTHVFPPGAYRMHVVVSASNMKPVDVTVEVDLSGVWSADDLRAVVRRYEVKAGRPSFAA